MKTPHILALSMLFTSQISLAETYLMNGNIYSNKGDFFVELGALTSSDYYKEQKDSTSILYNGGYRGDNFNIDLSGLNYRFFMDDTGIFNANIYAAISGSPYESSDAKVLAGMSQRRVGADLGLNGDINFGDGIFSLFFQHDVTGASGGYNTGLKYAHIFDFGAIDLVPFAGVTYYSDDYVDYYYGVKKSEAKGKRTAYKPEGEFVYTAGYKLIAELGENLNFNHSAAYVGLGDEMSKSPIMENDYQWLLTASISYHF
ncbi:MipA/OmpV family protein [Vibrio algarum]|uniref:MipA/OmpV family protein n=1 Tax=Vibrio algarum TaxID=3020714 RepID=A0ABT4YWL1_9VIBR|nr:MipA/OmpV family protein [Vibrio sp. KJ40-1]MDB1125978.1 MipA/OmpV family protein [Vibrio sp. KJ40-1]